MLFEFWCYEISCIGDAHPPGMWTLINKDLVICVHHRLACTYSKVFVTVALKVHGLGNTDTLLHKLQKKKS